MNKCCYITKTNKECTIKAKIEYILDNKYYCKKHFDQLYKQKNAKLDKINCYYISKNNKNCNTSAKKEYILDNKFYCKKHFEQLNKEPKSTNTKSSNTKSTTTKSTTTKSDNKSNMNDKKDDIINNIDIITKKINRGKLTNSMKTEYKKEIYKLLLKTHPDKCKLPNINAHEVTQQLTLLLQKIKI